MPTDVANSDQARTTTRPLQSAVFFGTGTGILGICLGGAVGILRSAHPGLAAAYTGVQFFVLGSSASLTRDAIVTGLSTTPTKTRDLIASTGAGVLSGGAAGRFWGRLTFIPGGLLFGTVGYFGQRHLHQREELPRKERDRRTLMQRLAESNWSPLQTLSNDDYHKVLTDRVEKLDAEIEVVDEKLQRLRQLQDIKHE